MVLVQNESVLFDTEAEEVTLGGMIYDPAQIPVVLQWLPDDSFFNLTAHRHIYRGIRTLHEASAPMDYLTLRRVIEEEGRVRWEDVQGAMGPILDVPMRGTHIVAAAKIVRDWGIRRNLRSTLTRVLAQVHDAGHPVDRLVTETVDGIVDMARGHVRATPPLTQMIWSALDDIESMHRLGTNVVGIPTGITGLDRLLHGFQPGHLTVLAARPSIGKTSFALAMARHALAQDAHVYFDTLEQPAVQLVKRLIAAEAGVDVWRMHEDLTHSLAVSGIASAAARIAGWNLTVDESSITPQALRLRVQQWRSRLEPGTPALVVVDYLGKMRSGRAVERNDLEVGARTWALSRMALELEIPVLCLHQLNRNNVRDGVRRPRLSDLRDSGEVEQDADEVVMLHPTGPGGTHAEDGLIEVNVVKNRHGETGMVQARFDRRLCRYTQATGREPPPYYAEGRTDAQTGGPDRE